MSTALHRSESPGICSYVEQCHRHKLIAACDVSEAPLECQQKGLTLAKLCFAESM